MRFIACNSLKDVPFRMKRSEIDESPRTVRDFSLRRIGKKDVIVIAIAEDFNFDMSKTGKAIENHPR